MTERSQHIGIIHECVHTTNMNKNPTIKNLIFHPGGSIAADCNTRHTRKKYYLSSKKNSCSQKNSTKNHKKNNKKFEKQNKNLKTNHSKPKKLYKIKQNQKEMYKIQKKKLL